MITNGNVEKLQAAGVIEGSGSLPKPYESVIEDLTDEEIAVLVSVKNRLEGVTSDVEEDHDWKFIVPF